MTTKLRQPPHANRLPAESFDERIQTLFDELSLAITWQRPSILIAVCKSDFACLEGQLALEEKLSKINQAIVPLMPDAEHFDIPLLLSQDPRRGQAVFFVKKLNLGQGTHMYHAYRALNIRRELLVDHQIRLVFWLTEQETADLPVHAPDFWAFRHRVIEFMDLPGPERVAALADALALKPMDMYARLGGSVEMAGTFRKVLKIYPLHLNLWRGLGEIYLQAHQTDAAIRAFRKANRIDPENAQAWFRLGEIYRNEGRVRGARAAYKTAIRIEPGNAPARISLTESYPKNRLKRKTGKN